MSESQRQKIRNIVRTELSLGKTHEEIFAMAESAGIDREMLIRETEKLKKKEFWDIVGDKISEKNFEQENAKNLKILEKYSANPSLPRRNLGLCLIPGILTLAALFLFSDQILGMLSSADEDATWILFLPFTPPFLYLARIFSLQRDLVKYAIARDQNWVYNPKESPSRWRVLRDKFSEIFDRGNRSQNISDEFWGDFSGNGKVIDFWTGIFSYTIKSGKHSTTYRRTLFAFHLEKSRTTRFCLKPEHSFFGLFRRKTEIHLESTEFNKSFAVFYNGQKAEKEQEIVKTLSPSLQVRLLEMKKKEGDFEVLFVDEVMLFSFSGKLIKKMKSNFFKKIEIDPRDSEVIKERLHRVFGIGSEMARFLD